MYAIEDITENQELLGVAEILQGHRIKNIDSLHIASAINAGANYFLTTDAGILKKAMHIQRICVTDPIEFIREVSP